MAEFTLKQVEVKTLKVNIGEDSFQIPLQGSLTWKEVLALETSEGTYAFMKTHVPKEVFDKLKVDEYNQLVEAWKAESIKAAGKSAGES